MDPIQLIIGAVIGGFAACVHYERCGPRVPKLTKEERDMILQFRDWKLTMAVRQSAPSGCGSCASPCSESESNVSDPSF